jgi:L-alanine-DL-glutamate epimerase-like enolase superfamily enzyme
MKLVVRTELWPLDPPLIISRGAIDVLELLLVELEEDGVTGRGEAVGIPYAGETAAGMRLQIEAIRARIERGIDRSALQDLLGPGGARNAIDCALWDLDAKRSGQPAWAAAGLSGAPDLVSAATIGMGDTAAVEAHARKLADFPLIKIKLGPRNPVEAVRIVRMAAPAARLIVDPNQSWSIEQLNNVAIDLATLGVALIEQPLPIGQDDALRHYSKIIPLAADESCTDRASLPALAGLYDYVNIKLDKTGGLTEALALADAGREAGFRLMVGCMAGTSLSMAPAMIVAAKCDLVDLDGPLVHGRDRDGGIGYECGRMTSPAPGFWGDRG